ncbi:Sterile alpha motif (SAM) domain-containing protein [Thalictrum thalictroides]|uniref:Sterile alpha motif (SAM) domain-containing protein n=1 Tax=Thalictrum thalictroides TaxID=46969 RepID=A0A7J6X0L7_THATH|nr:Sterile alpha motif (SAM) domain-containing protein [Thalictrum thalictroides]
MSRPKVTITLGRTGQVVKRPESSNSEYVPLSGNKRSVRDRLGSNADTSSINGNQQKSKRQRRDNKRSLGNDDVDGVRVSKNDLRYKLMRKKEGKRNNIDLREKLSRAAKHQVKNDTKQRMPDPRASDTRQRMPEPRASDSRQRMAESRASDTRQRMPEPRTTDTQQRMPEPRSAGLLRRIPPTSSADDIVQMDSVRNSYSSWALDGLRRRSPDRLLGTSRGLSPPRTMDPRRSVGQISSVTHVDAPRPTTFIGNDVFDASRPTSFMPKASVPLEAVKPVVRHPPPIAPTITQRVAYTGEEVNVSTLLNSLGLGKYAIIFQAEEVDMTALKQMGDADLKDLGIPMGPRKKILLSVAGRPKRHP